MEPDGKIKLKVAMVGDTAVGKTAIAVRFAYNSFQPNIGHTPCAEIFEKDFIINGKEITIEIVDTAGQEVYKSLTKNYYRNVHAVIIVFAVGSYNKAQKNGRSSFENVGEWYSDVVEINNTTNIAICGNMTDLQNREVSFEEGQQKASSISESIPYFETSALTGEGIEALFQYIAKKHLESYNSEQPVTVVNPAQSNEKTDKKKSGCFILRLFN
ncbi:putative ras-related protein Rab-6 [Histomonas meleagridis]|uniref:putative ras-related protein Rab-6 n=1 Tax=Histomonas meleagridis TaxID=135588 RepID=UPI00355A07CE|nr:putative ras-related protein Rab-6 [Histomonas meleagridis]KAH0796203.1 putative ras-related protein Rab-6 [Histomonas meleagridis]